jgi:predicted lactoylglutathione lyase
MSRKIFLNLAVKDVAASMAFYEQLGFKNNPQFSDENAKCMICSETIFVMLLSQERFMSFTNRPIADISNATAQLNSLELESVEAMNSMMEKGISAGGTESGEAKDYGFMQQRSLLDLDGHYWELFYMDMSKFPTEENV